MLPDASPIDFCICTYDRLYYLEKCVKALLPQVELPHVITIVDNSPKASARESISNLIKEHPLINYLHETTPGLSHARNAAWKTSVADWIFYMDDDSEASAELVKHATELITIHPEIDAFGGPIQPIFDKEIPEWVPEGFGEFSMPFNEVTVMENGYARGPCFLVKKSVLQKLGGFDPELGVKGKQLAYGEEIELQHRMRSAGYKIAYAPQLRMGHHVRTEKLTLRWLLRSEFARRRDKMKFDSIGFGLANWHVLRTLLSRLYHGPMEALKATTKKHYPFRRALYETLKPLAFRFGEWTGTWWSFRHKPNTPKGKK